MFEPTKLIKNIVFRNLFSTIKNTIELISASSKMFHAKIVERAVTNEMKSVLSPSKDL